MKKIITTIAVIGAIILLIVGYKTNTLPTTKPILPKQTATTTPETPTSSLPEKTAVSATSELVLPIDRTSERLTKKFFGTFITPKNSPVQPERFTGFHTGLDFETFPSEQNSDVTIYVICSGKLLRKDKASGYGGYAVQACTINDQTVTVVYGHLRLASISAKSGQALTAGDYLGILGTEFSTETDGERKHLHLSISIGDTVNIKGYVQNKVELSAWLDPRPVLGL